MFKISSNLYHSARKETKPLKKAIRETLNHDVQYLLHYNKTFV